MRAYLVHGMGRSPVSLALLGARLRKTGFQTSSFGYIPFAAPLAQISQRFVAHVEATYGGEPYAIVTHSLGGIITRLASPALPAGFSRFVMLAPPNSPSAMARKAAASRIFRALAGDAGQRLGDEAFYATLPIPSVPTLVIGGTGGPRLRTLPFGDAPHDGIVSLAETRLHGADHRAAPCIHTFIMNDRTVTSWIVEFLRAPPPRPVATV